MRATLAPELMPVSGDGTSSHSSLHPTGQYSLAGLRPTMHAKGLTSPHARSPGAPFRSPSLPRCSPTPRSLAFVVEAPHRIGGDMARHVGNHRLRLLPLDPHSLPVFDLPLRWQRSLWHGHAHLLKAIDDPLSAGTHPRHQLGRESHRVPHQGHQDILRSDRPIAESSGKSLSSPLHRIEGRGKGHPPLSLGFLVSARADLLFDPG
jgi:hypothetical protein